MAIKTPGALGAIEYINENDYGVTPEPAAMKYLGFMISCHANGDPGAEEHIIDGSRLPGEATFNAHTAGLSLELGLYGDYENYQWANIIALAMGSRSGIQDAIPSFTAIMKFASDQYGMITGAAIDSLTLSTEGVGKKITAKAEIKGKKLWEQKATVEEYGHITLEDAPPLHPITYNAYPTTNISGIPIIPAHKFTYKITNGLTPQEGIDSDGSCYAAGNGLIPGQASIELEYEITSTDKLWDNLKMAGTSGFNVEHIIGGHKFTFSNCHLPGTDQPNRSQTVYNETITIRCNGGLVIE